MTIFTPLPGSKLYTELNESNQINSHNPGDYNYGNYLIKDDKNPLFIQFLYFGLLLMHYFLPDTFFKAFFSKNKVIRTFNQRAYIGAFRFVMGTIFPFGASKLGDKK